MSQASSSKVYSDEEEEFQDGSCQEPYTTSDQDNDMPRSIPIAPTIPSKIPKPTQKMKPGIVPNPKIAKKTPVKKVKAKCDKALETANGHISSLEDLLDEYYMKCERLHKAASSGIDYMTSRAVSLYKELEKINKDLATTRQQSRDFRTERDNKSKLLTAANNNGKSLKSKYDAKRDKVIELTQQLYGANEEISRLKKELSKKSTAPAVGSSIQNDAAKAHIRLLESQAKMSYKHQLDQDKAQQAKASKDQRFASVTGALGAAGSGLLGIGANGAFQLQSVSFG
jgi:chromosome segregation ATPase